VTKAPQNPAVSAANVTKIGEKMHCDGFVTMSAFPDFPSAALSARFVIPTP
jgi:hypothetical protein